MRKGVVENIKLGDRKGITFSILGLLARAYNYPVITIQKSDFVKIPKEYSQNVDVKNCKPIQLIASKENVRELLDKTEFFDSPVLLVSLRENA